MKNLAKIFMAIAVAMFAFSCVNDATEDIAVKVGGKTTLAISLENTRTQLGEAADGVYPITWAEGDQITVNGETSNELTAADGAGTANAVFTFNTENLSAPYCVAYPAAEANQVVFAAEQEYVEGTFANGAAIMYGYATNGNITLNHLTGVLKIGVVCGEDVDIFEAPVIQAVKISTIDRAPIAGAFNINFETGVVTPTAEATSVITYNVDMKLSQDPTYLHIAVPAGVYNELYVTLEDSNGGVMYKTVTAGDNEPLVAGKVREFSSDIVYKATTTTDKHIIKDYASLLAFKNAVEGGSQLDAVFAGDVDLNGVDWGSINAGSYKGTIYGNGFAIKGLNAPLFEATSASFKGLHLNVNITETATLFTGSFTRKSSKTATDKNALFENCSASGTITINNQSYTTDSSNRDVANIGAFVGRSYGADFKNCTNNVNINLKQVQLGDKQTTTVYVSVGGFLGYTNNIVNFENCTNKGNITWAEENANRILFYLAGFLGMYRNGDSQGTIHNCCNSGNFDVKASSRGGKIGGFIAYGNGASDKTKTITFTGTTTNTGNVTLAGTHANNATQIGGIFGYVVDSTTAVFEGPVVNSGIFNFTSNHTAELSVGGIIGDIYNKSVVTFNKSVTNNGAINFAGTEASTSAIRLGGIVGNISVVDCHLTFNDTATNTESADIIVTAPTSTLICGGIVARTCRDEGDNKVNIYVYFNNKTTTNNGHIYVNSTATGSVYLGGISGYSYLTTYKYGGNCRVVNNGAITVGDNAKIESNLYVAGVNCYINGGGSANVSTSSVGQRVNNGDISISGEFTKDCFIGGLSSYHNLGTTVNSINTGNITVTAKFDTSKTIRIGGAYANHRVGLESSKITMANAQVYCDIAAYMVTKDENSGEYTITPHSNSYIGIFSGQVSISTIKDCKVGGRIATTAIVENGVVKPVWVEMVADNYMSYLFGTRDYQTNTNTNNTLLSSVADIAWGNFGE